jgi:hypothetical protein
MVAVAVITPVIMDFLDLMGFVLKALIIICTLIFAYKFFAPKAFWSANKSKIN